jgi:8-oxo-dGTP pyrophosphatase MutT (NUDIX family)
MDRAGGGLTAAPLGREVMAKPTRKDDWGFPRWRPYGTKGSAAARVRLCDREGCDEAGDRPAPKAPNSPERWMFCQSHAAEYNKGWDYFAGLTPEEAARRAAEEEAGASAFRKSAHYQWAGPGDGSRSRDEMRAYEALEIDPEADPKEIKAAYRKLAKQFHPDVNRDDQEAAKRFQQVQAAYDVLRKAAERRGDVI